MRPMTNRSHAIVLGLGIAAITVVAVEAFLRMQPLRSATAAPLSISVRTPELGPPHFTETFDVSTFQRGNIHTHSEWSDGDRSPKFVYDWYRTHGYQFLALTDHDNRVSPETFKILQKPGFVIIAGEEVTMNVGDKPVHVNGLCTTKTIGGGRFPTKRAALVHAVESIHAQGGSALVNHPNFGWALTVDDVREVNGAEMLEIWSGHPYVHTEGDAERPSHEAIWDKLVDSGQTIAGVAVDDSHHFGMTKKPEAAARPGKGWVEVFSAQTERDAICEGLMKGRLYSSSGATLSRIRLTTDKLSVWVKEEGASVEFIGNGGTVLAKRERGTESEVTYELRGDERYVRARITLPNGKMAWTQPYRVVR